MDIPNPGYQGKWGALLLKYERGQLQKPEVVKLLESGEPVTAEAQPMLAKIISNDGKDLKGGRPTLWPGDGLRITSDASVAQTADHMVQVFKSYIENPSLMDQEDIHPRVRGEMEAAHRRTQRKHRQHTTAHQEAMEWVADALKISVRKLQEWRRAVRR